jgi:O-antigen/teichoic acid export membrane protein
MDFLKKVIFVFINKQVGFIADFISSILIVRYLGADEYGYYTTLYLLPILVSSLGAFGFGPSIVYYINRGSISIREYLNTFSILGLLLGLVFVMIAISLFEYINEYFYDGLLKRDLFLISILFIPAVITQKYLRSIIRGIYEIKVFTILLDLIQPFMRLALILFVFYGDYELAGIVIIPVVVQITITACMFLYLFKKSSDEIRTGFIQTSEFVTIARFAFKGYLGAALQKSSSTLIMVIASALLTFRDIGILSLATKLVGLISGLSGAIMTVLMPKVSRSTISEIQIYIPRAFSLLLTFNIIILFIYLIFVDLIVLNVYGEDFLEVSVLSIPLGLAAILLPLCNILLLTLTFTGDPLKKLYARGFGLLVNIALCYPLYFYYGSLGFAIAMGIGQLAIFAMSLVFFKRKFGDISLNQLFVFRLADIQFAWKTLKGQLKIKEGISKT